MLRNTLAAAALLLAIAGAAWPAPATAPAAAVSGPLRVENAYPPMLPFLLLPAEAPSAPQPGDLALSGSVAYGNIFHCDPQVLYADLDVLIDGEVLKLTLSADYGLAPGLAVGLRLWLAGAYGGVLDPLIQGFHALFGLPNADREYFPDNRYGFRVIRAGQVMVDLDEPFLSLGDLALSAKWTLLDGRERGPGAALQAAVSLPAGSAEHLTSNGALDVSLGLLGSWRWPRFAAYGGLRYVRLGEPDWGEVLGFRAHNLGFFACLEWAPTAGLAWLVQADGTTLPYRHPHRWLNGISSSISFGSRIRLSRRLLLQVHTSEELFSFAQLDISASATVTFVL